VISRKCVLHPLIGVKKVLQTHSPNTHSPLGGTQVVSSQSAETLLKNNRSESTQKDSFGFIFINFETGTTEQKRKMVRREIELCLIFVEVLFWGVLYWVLYLSGSYGGHT
jgi:hypothetical protein